MRRSYKQIFILSILFGCSFSVFAQKKLKDKTSFQISDSWNAAYDIRSDIAMVYGVNDAGGHFEQRVKGWRDKGYNVQFMTGSAWGQYKDYFLRKFDGKTHFDEGQQMKNGETIWHGENVPYVVPTENYLKYLKTHIKRAIDAGGTAIYLEEPEFWARSGYSPAFKKEWRSYYGTNWQPEDESAEATYLASKLKYHLYYHALNELFAYAKSYSKSKGHEVKCFVPTHSLINYSSWQIVSPEASLASLKDMDGYIAQVWTGTAREPIYYNGLKKERVFENAFLEYGSMVSMTAPTKRKLYFLTDPVEDRARSWNDYKRNYQATFIAELMYPSVDNYEVMPWPQRIYLGRFKMDNNPVKQPISPAYATQMQVMINALNFMPLSENELNGSHGIGVLIGNSMMFQRFPIHAGYNDPQLSNFYGMVMPLLKRGIPLETVHMENLRYANTLKNIKVLVMSYANMKPMSEEVHIALTKWVNRGGVLMYYGRDKDPFQNVKEWWNTDGKSYTTASQDLFAKLRIIYNADKEQYKVGRGTVFIIREDPKEIAMNKAGDTSYFKTVKYGYEGAAKAGSLMTKNNLLIQRGPYIIASVLDESVSKTPLVIHKNVIDLFDPELPILHKKIIQPGNQAFLYDLENIQHGQPQVLAAASRVYRAEINNKTHSYSFITKSPSNTIDVMRIVLPSEPTEVSTSLSNGAKITLVENVWDETSHTVLLKFENYSEGVNVNIRW